MMVNINFTGLSSGSSAGKVGTLGHMECSLLNQAGIVHHSCDEEIEPTSRHLVMRSAGL